MLTILSDRKGNVIMEGITIVVGILIFAFLIVYGYMAFSEVNEMLINDTEINNATTNVTTRYVEQYQELNDNLLPLLFVGLWIAALLLALFVDAHPVGVAIVLFGIIVLMIGAAEVSNVYIEEMADSDISLYSEGYTKTAFIIGNIVQILIAVVISISIVLYTKLRGGR